MQMSHKSADGERPFKIFFRRMRMYKCGAGDITIHFERFKYFWEFLEHF